MSQEVILMEDVPGLGNTGEIVRVADGYARNFLFPRKAAAAVTAATRKMVEKRQVQAEAKRAKVREDAVALAAQIGALSVSITAKAGPEGKLFGSIGNADIIQAAKGQGLALEKHQIELPEPLRELGVFTVPVKLVGDVQAELKVWIVEE
ncbi:MAG: 50S ribosomal protein L9 [bacterium]